MHSKGRGKHIEIKGTYADWNNRGQKRRIRNTNEDITKLARKDAIVLMWNASVTVTIREDWTTPL